VSDGDYVEQRCGSCGAKHVLVEHAAVRCTQCGTPDKLTDDVIYMEDAA
jgi:uncharacterized Zn finger protein